MDFDNINDIINNLSAEDIDSLRSAAQSVLGGSDGEKKTEKEEQGSDFSSFFTPEMLGKLSRLMSMMNKRDSRADLIAALKPHLSRSKQKKADEAMQIIRLLDILPLIGEQFGGEQ